MTIQRAADHQREKRLEQLAAVDDPLRLFIERAGDERAWWPSDLNWRRIYGRFDPGKRPYGTFVYETESAPQRLAVVHLSDDEPFERSRHSCMILDEAFAWVRIMAFPSDPKLPGLTTLLSAPGQTHVVRYRPYKRCTLKVEGADGRICFVKIFADDRGARIHGDSDALWRSAGEGELAFAVAEPIRWDPAINALWQHAVSGQPVVPFLFGDDGEVLADAMGRAAASITQSSLRPTLSFDAAAQLERTQGYTGELAARVPDAAGLLVELSSTLRDLHAAGGGDRLRPLHGSPHAHQWLLQDDRLGLVDFDRLSLGDPELDAATFLAEMDFEDPKEVPIRSLNASFLEGYQSVAGRLNSQLLRAYRLHKYLAKALKAARAVRPDAPKRALRNLRRAKACLQDNAS